MHSCWVLHACSGEYLCHGERLLGFGYWIIMLYCLTQTNSSITTKGKRISKRMKISRLQKSTVLNLFSSDALRRRKLVWQGLEGAFWNGRPEGAVRDVTDLFLEYAWIWRKVRKFFARHEPSLTVCWYCLTSSLGISHVGKGYMNQIMDGRS